MVGAIPLAVLAFWSEGPVDDPRALVLVAAAALVVVASLTWQERAWVRAGQAIPIS